MYQAEHLDLFTTVQDEFTDDLTRLSGLLETVGEQADALDPIRIHVVVHDSQLQQLQHRIATTDLADTVDFDLGDAGAVAHRQLRDRRGHAQRNSRLTHWAPQSGPRW